MRIFFSILCICFFIGGTAMAITQPQISAQKPTPPKAPVKLLFIHHSVGGHWLAHNNGGLANELNKNNYYVNDVTYGWEPAALTDTLPKKIKRKFLGTFGKENKGAYNIGDRTDIGQMADWFLGPDTDLIMGAIYKENLETDNFGDHRNSQSEKPLKNPGPAVENQVIMFKSCFPNTLLHGNPSDPASQAAKPVRNFSAGSKEHTVANAKRIYNDLLTYFGKHPDKFFVMVTPPPQTELPEDGKIARGFSNWLVHDWLKENSYAVGNVMVFDLFNVLTSGNGANQNDAGEVQGNHHRIWNGKVQHIVQTENNLLVYPRKSGDNHPSPAGLQKATQEFVPLLNYYYAQWKNR